MRFFFVEMDKGRNNRSFFLAKEKDENRRKRAQLLRSTSSRTSFKRSLHLDIHFLCLSLGRFYMMKNIPRRNIRRGNFQFIRGVFSPHD